MFLDVYHLSGNLNWNAEFRRIQHSPLHFSIFQKHSLWINTNLLQCWVKPMRYYNASTYIDCCFHTIIYYSSFKLSQGLDALASKKNAGSESIFFAKSTWPWPALGSTCRESSHWQASQTHFVGNCSTGSPTQFRWLRVWYCRMCKLLV